VPQKLSCWLVQDAQRVQSSGELLGLHGTAVIAHQGPGQGAFLQRLRETMHQGLGGLIEVPLQVADQTRVVVDDRQHQRCGPGPGTGEHLARTVMEVQMPEGVNVLGLVAAHLAGLQAPGSLLSARGSPGIGAAAMQPGTLHKTAHGGIGG
jgi:hypothetical protein